MSFNGIGTRINAVTYNAGFKYVQVYEVVQGGLYCTDMLRPGSFYGIQYGNNLRCPNEITNSPLLFIGAYWMGHEFGITSSLRCTIMTGAAASQVLNAREANQSQSQN